MCGRITQTKGALEGFVSLTMFEPDPRYADRWNGAPSQHFAVIRRHPETGEHVAGILKWGFSNDWMRDHDVKPQVNARCETVATKGLFAKSYATRRCLVPIDNFFEWQKTKGGPKQPYAVAMADLSPYTVAGIWTGFRDENRKWQHTFAILTCAANELVGTIHERMPVIIAAEDRDRWLGIEPDPSDLLRPYPSDLMQIWPISTRVNSPDNDTRDILDRVD